MNVPMTDLPELKELRRRVQWLQALCALITISMTVLLLSAFARQTPSVQDVVTSKSFVLVDDSGKTLGTLGKTSGGLTEFRLSTAQGGGAVILDAGAPNGTSAMGSAQIVAGIYGPGGAPFGGVTTGINSNSANLSIGVQTVDFNKHPHIDMAAALANGSHANVCGSTSSNCPNLTQQ